MMMSGQSGQIKSEAKISPLWDIGHDCGIAQRVVDIINQCRYLASKEGMSLKEIRQRMREDEAKQRQLVRYADMCNKQMQFVSPAGITNMLNSGTTTSPGWFGQMNNHGMMYSQYNVQNYGDIGSTAVVNDQGPKNFQSQKKGCGCMLSSARKPNQENWEYHQNKENFDKDLNRKENQMKAEAKIVKSGNVCSSKDQLLKSSSQNVNTKSESVISDNSNDNILSLLYRANMANRGRGNNSSSTCMKISPPDTSRNGMYNYCKSATSSTEFTNVELVKCPIMEKVESSYSSGSCNKSESRSQYKLPARKLASYNLASLCAAEDEEDSTIITIARRSNSSLDMEQNSDSEFEISEIQIVEELDRGNDVVTPFNKTVRSAFSDLQKSDHALFGTLDDFGNLMNQANYIL